MLNTRLFDPDLKRYHQKQCSSTVRAEKTPEACCLDYLQQSLTIYLDMECVRASVRITGKVKVYVRIGINRAGRAVRPKSGSQSSQRFKNMIYNKRGYKKEYSIPISLCG